MPVSWGSVPCDTTYRTSKRQNYRPREQVSGCQGLRTAGFTMRLPERNSSEGWVPGRSLQGPHRKHTCTDVHSPCHARQNQMGHRLARDALRPCRTLPPNAGSTRHGIQDHVWCQTKVDALTVDGCFWPLVPFWWPRHCQEDGRPAPPRPPCAGHTQRTTYNTHLPPLGPHLRLAHTAERKGRR